MMDKHYNIRDETTYESEEDTTPSGMSPAVYGLKWHDERPWREDRESGERTGTRSSQCGGEA